MPNETLYIPNAFRNSKIILLLILPIVLLTKIDLINQGDEGNSIIGIILIIAFLFSIIGSYQNIKGINEQHSIKKYASILVNFGMFFTFIYILYSSFIEV